MQEAEIHNLPDMSKDGWKHACPKLPELVDSSRCNNADINWYVRMPINPSLVDTKVEMPLE